jgi:hypothetical protein
VRRSFGTSSWTPRGKPGSTATWLVLDALLAGPGGSGPAPGGGSTGGPIGRLTIGGVGAVPIVRDLVGEPHRLVAGPIAACSAGCRLELSVTFESLEIRPGAHLRLDWSAGRPPSRGAASRRRARSPSACRPWIPRR